MEKVGELGLYRLAISLLKANLKEAYNYSKGSYKNYGVKFFSGAPHGVPSQGHWPQTVAWEAQAGHLEKLLH